MPLNRVFLEPANIKEYDSFLNKKLCYFKMFIRKKILKISINLKIAEYKAQLFSLNRKKL